jgi:hypothetical protein
MTLAGTQTVTGPKTFGSAGAVGRLILAGNTSGTTILNAAAVAGSGTITLPTGTTTLAGLGTIQTFTAAQTFSSTIAYSPTSGTALSIGATSSGTQPNINWSGGAAIGMTGIGGGSYALTYSFNSVERIRMYGGVNGDNYFLLGTTSLSAVLTIKDISSVSPTPGIALFDGVNKTLAPGVTEIINFHVNGAYTWTRNPNGAGLTQATQRHNVFAAPTYAATVSAYTITNAATVAISGAPAAGASMTITNPLAFWVQAGVSQFDGNVLINSALTITGGVNIALSITTGTKIGTATNQLLGFWNATPIIQPASANQAAITDSTTGTAGFTLVDVGAIFSQTNINNNFASLNRQVDAFRTALVNAGIIKGAA